MCAGKEQGHYRARFFHSRVIFMISFLVKENINRYNIWKFSRLYKFRKNRLQGLRRKKYSVSQIIMRTTSSSFLDDSDLDVGDFKLTTISGCW